MSAFAKGLAGKSKGKLRINESNTRGRHANDAQRGHHWRSLLGHNLALVPELAGERSRRHGQVWTEIVQGQLKVFGRSSCN